MSLPTIRRVLTSALAIALLVPIFSACNKEEPTKVIISVKTESGSAVSGAKVRLFANPTYPYGDPHRLDMESTTGADGRAEFDYSDFYEQGQSGFAVLDIEGSKDTLFGEGIIKVIEEETSEETVYLLPVD